MKLKHTDCVDTAEYQARSTRSGRIFYVTFCDGVGWDAEGNPWRPDGWPELNADEAPCYNKAVEFYFLGKLT